MNKEKNRRGFPGWMKIECPKCHALPWHRCFCVKGDFTICCKERYSPSTGKLYGAYLSKRDFPIIKGRRYSSYCGNLNQHGKCPGSLFMKGHHGGVREICQCQCHGKFRAYLPLPPRKQVNPLESYSCQKGKHEKCSKVRRLPNNLYAPCECQCHQENP
jgi:hypothetical protein